MSNDFARAADGVGVGVLAPLAERTFGTTRWQVDRWDADQTTWAQKRLVYDRPTIEHLPWPLRRVEAADFARLRIAPYRSTEVVGNLITNAGWTRLMNLLTNQGATQALTATAVRIGAGDSNTAEAYTDTNLGTNKWFQVVTGAGTLGTRTLAFAATFGTSDGNFAWNEFGLDVGTPTVTSSSTVAALLFNRKAGIAQGTKASGQTWTATATITFS